MRKVLFINLISLCWLLVPLASNGQQRAFIFSANKDFEKSFNQLSAFYLRYNFSIGNSWYLSISSGIRNNEWVTFERTFTDRFDNHLNLGPQFQEFPLDPELIYFEPSLLNVGHRQNVPKNIFYLAIPLGISVGKNWLKDNNKFGIYSDIGGGITYVHRVLYGWGDNIGIEGVTPPEGHDYFYLYGKTISRELIPHIDFKVDFTYFLLDNLGIGLNFYYSGVIHHDSHSQYGIHLRYQY